MYSIIGLWGYLKFPAAVVACLIALVASADAIERQATVIEYSTAFGSCFSVIEADDNPAGADAQGILATPGMGQGSGSLFASSIGAELVANVHAEVTSTMSGFHLTTTLGGCARARLRIDGIVIQGPDPTVETSFRAHFLNEVLATTPDPSESFAIDGAVSLAIHQGLHVFSFDGGDGGTLVSPVVSVPTGSPFLIEINLNVRLTSRSTPTPIPG